MGEDPQELEREIERTRAKLGQDLDALEEKINPKKVASRSVGRAKEKAADVKDKVVEAAGTAKDKVAGAAAEAKDKVAGGTSDATDPDRDAIPSYGAHGEYAPDGADTTVGSDGAGIGEKVSGLAGTVKEKALLGAGAVKDKAAPLAASAKEKAAPLASSALDKAAPLAASAKEKAAVRSGLDPQTADTREVATAFAGGTWATVQDQTRRNPWAVATAAFLIGVLLGR